MQLWRLFHSGRHLRPGQIAHRLSRRWRRPPRLAESETAGYRLRERQAEPRIVVGEPAFDGKAHRFLSKCLLFAGPQRWEPEGVAPLWRYQLHGFGYLQALDGSAALALIDDWMAANPPPAGTGWEPYPLSMRIREWIEWLHANRGLPDGAARRIVSSLVYQTRALEAQLEFHLRGNHLLENGISLCWAGLSLEGPLAERWIRRGVRILDRELPVQILEDGTHDERSPMYQALIAEALLRLAAIAGSSAGPEAGEIARRCRRAGLAAVGSLAQLTHPDGEIALLNDAVCGWAPTHRQLARRYGGDSVGGVREPGLWRLPEAGYLGWRSEAGTYLCFDAGPLGPDHCIAHAHADMLSFELSHRGRRLVTDTGVYAYTAGPRRLYDRGTAAHNTIEVDGRNQSDVWADFRCGRRARIESAWARSSSQELTLGGSFRAPLSGLTRMRHRRQLRLSRRHLYFRDHLLASGTHRAAVRLHLAPGLRHVVDTSGLTVVDEDGAALAAIRLQGGDFRAEASPYHPHFGLEIERLCLVWRQPFELSCELSWQIELL